MDISGLLFAPTVSSTGMQGFPDFQNPSAYQYQALVTSQMSATTSGSVAVQPIAPRTLSTANGPTVSGYAAALPNTPQPTQTNVDIDVSTLPVAPTPPVPSTSSPRISTDGR